MIPATAPSPPPNNTMDSAAFREAVAGATLPGFAARIESDLAGVFVVWTPLRGPGEVDVYATPEWEDTAGFAVMIHHDDGAMYTADVAVAWTDDPVENAHLYLAAMRRWLQGLPTIYGQWDGGDERDFNGTVVDWCERFHDTNLFEPSLWDGEEHGDFFEAVECLTPGATGATIHCDNMAIRLSPFPTAIRLSPSPTDDAELVTDDEARDLAALIRATDIEALGNGKLR